MEPRKNEVIVILGINNEKDAKNVFLEDSFIHGGWVSFQSLEEEGFTIKGFFDCIRWMSFLQNFSVWYYGPYALFWGTSCQNKVSISGTVKGIKVVISLVTIATVSSLVEEDFAFDKDWQYDISQETIDMMLYGKPQSKVDDRKEMISFLRTANLTYMCKLIHNFFVQRGYAQARVQSLC